MSCGRPPSSPTGSWTRFAPTTPTHVHLNHPAAGHLALGLAYAPAPIEETVTGPYGRTYVLTHSGSEGADAAARASDWPAILRFIASN